MNPDNPKFTAHVLGETEDLTPAERAEIEALLANDPVAFVEAAETLTLAERLRAELPGEEAAPLHEAQHRKVLAALVQGDAAFPVNVVSISNRVPWLKRKSTLGIAACMAVLVSLFGMLAVVRYQGAQAVLAGSGISDPRGLRSYHPIERALFRAGDKLTGGKVAKDLAELSPIEPSDLDPAPAATATPASPPAATAQGPVARRFAGRGGMTLAGGKNVYVSGVPINGGTLIPEELDVDTRRIAIVEDLQKLKENEARRRNLEQREPANTEAFDVITDNAFLSVRENPLSTFSIDVDTASYAIVRRFLNQQQRPPKGAVRIEELLNYFTYDYPPPQGDAPFSATMEGAACPWTPEHRLVRIGLKGREIAKDKRPASNLVFLIDVSGSMQPENKLPLLKQSLALLIDQLGSEDQVAMVVYAGNSGCVLEPTRDKREMHAALRKLEAGGSTNGASGIQLAYQLAEQSFIKGGTNRVILATDGDWNVGVTNQSDLLDMIAQKAKSGVFLTVMGFGMGNLKDSMLVKLADRGNGNYAYIDTLAEAKKVLVEQMSGTLVTIAKDVKIQVEFNPAQVSSYRLIGYEKRVLAKEDFNDDKKDAGEIGAGHTVTALYEVVPAGRELPQIAKVDALKYQPEKNAPRQGRVLPKAERAPQDGRAELLPPHVPQAMPAPPEKSDPYKVKPYLLNEQAAADKKPTTVETPKEAPELLILPNGSAPNSEPQIASLPAGKKASDPSVAASPASVSGEMLTLKLRYKEPTGDTSKLLEFPLTDAGTTWEKSTRDFRFAAAVASYGMLLRDSPHKGSATWSSTHELAIEGKGEDASGYRAEFLSLIELAKAVTR